MIELILPPRHVAAWPKAEPLLAKATARFDTGFETPDLFDRINIGRSHLWKVNDWDAAVITEIQTWPTHRSLLVCYLGGVNLDDWFEELMIAIEMAAVQWKCKYVEVHGRRGWLKPGSKRGYSEVTTVFRKQVDG